MGVLPMMFYFPTKEQALRFVRKVAEKYYIACLREESIIHTLGNQELVDVLVEEAATLGGWPLS